MLIGKKYKLESDPMNISLSERHKSKKDGGNYWRVIGCFSTPKEALHYMVNLGIRESNLTDLKKVVKEVERLHKIIDGLKFKESITIEEGGEQCTSPRRKKKTLVKN